MALLQGAVQGCHHHVPHRPINAVHVRPKVNQHLAHLSVVIGGRCVQQRSSIVAGRVHLFRSLFQQPLDEFSPTGRGRLVHWKITAGIPQPEIGFVGMQNLHRFKLSLGTTTMRRCSSLSVLAVRVRFLGQQQRCGVCVTERDGVMKGSAAVAIN